jgi:hypothetical protein
LSTTRGAPMRASWAEFHPKRRQCYIVMRWECVSDKEMHRVHKRWCFVPEKANVPYRLRIDEGLFSIDWSSCHENSPYRELILTLLSSFFATIVLQVKGCSSVGRWPMTQSTRKRGLRRNGKLTSESTLQVKSLRVPSTKLQWNHENLRNATTVSHAQTRCCVGWRTLKSASFYPPVGGDAEHRIIAKAQIMSFGLTAGLSQC